MNETQDNASRYATALGAAAHWLCVRLIRHRLILLTIFALITVFLGYHAAFLRMDPGFNKSIPVSHPYMKTYAEYSNVFGGANVLVVALMRKDGEIFTPEFMQTLEKATQDVLFINGVDRSSVTSLFTPNVSFVAVNEEGFVGYRIVPPDFAPTPEAVKQVQYNLLQSQYLGQLASRDFRGALIRAELVDRDPQSGEPLDYRQVARTLEEIRARYENGDVSVHIIGFAKFTDDVISGALGVIVFFGIALLITAVMLYFYSNSLQITVLALVVAICAVVWQLGLVQLLGYGIDPLSILVPFLILAIGVSHAIQMTNTWKLEVIAGASSDVAAAEAFNKLFIPGTTALLANAVGFAVIMIIDIAIIHELGITASIGVAVMIVTNKFLLPVLLSYARMSSRTVERLRAKAQDRHRPVWWAISAFATRKWGAVAIVLGAVALVFGVWQGRALIIGDSEAGAPEFWPDARYNLDINAIISNFNVGIDELTVIAEMPKNGCVDYAIMSGVDRLAWALRNTDGVQAVSTLSTVIKERAVGNNEGHLKFYALPRNSYALGSSLRGIELSQKLFNDTCEALPVRALLRDHEADTLRRAVETVQEFERTHGVPGLEFKLALGGAGVMAATNEAVADAEMTMLMSLFAAVGVLCFLTFLSWRAVLCILLPLALVSLLANAVMVLLGIGLKVSTLPVVALGVGVGVDYGIYLFARTQANIRRGLALREAYYEGLKQAGTAVVFTATTMSIGVATWFFSDLKFQSDMGVLLGYMFFVNMLGAVFLLPGLAAWLIDEAAERKRTAGLPH